MVEKSIKGSCIAFLEVKEILEVVVMERYMMWNLKGIGPMSRFSTS